MFGGRNRSHTSGLPDIVVDPKLTSNIVIFSLDDFFFKRISFIESPKDSKKSEGKPLNVLGYPNVQTTPVNSTIRQELQSLNHEVCQLMYTYIFQLLQSIFL